MGIWATAKNLAAKTPAERNRYVDFLRGVSILVVIIGHWLIATAWYVDGELITGHLLKDQPQTQWLTWLFQVMPVFFIVGGYANGVSLESAGRKGLRYADWLVTRLTRLVVPVLVLLVIWAGFALTQAMLGVRPLVIQYMSQAALMPTWSPWAGATISGSGSRYTSSVLPGAMAGYPAAPVSPSLVPWALSCSI